MGSLVKVQSKGQMTIPRGVRSAVGLADGDFVEVRVVGKKIVITPQLVIDRSKIDRSKIGEDDDYTPAQRRLIDARLAKFDDEIKRGRLYGPFRTHQQFVTAIRREAAKLARSKTKRRS